ncbi:HD-GYP domain-containing protein [Nitrospira sp. KM1]|uniref:HD-GYP domain-containing protein n=1 Tax=Nitrospira sp. KM1 TaxID=1936990 RepID=UPI001564DA66|nr:HD-GYP domain-containing protein [Nitrospira sp. KM1]
MKKHISIDELTVGMKILKLDKPWAETPFLRHRIRITQPQQINALRACGVRVLDVEVDEAQPETVTDAPLPASELAHDPTEIDSSGEGENSGRSQETRSFDEELPAARQAYHAAKDIIGRAMADARMGRDISMDVVSQVVTAMADSVLRNPDALTSLSRLKRFDEYTFFHSVNTSLLGLALGRNLGLGRQSLHHLGVGTLLHDIGKTRIPLEILNKPGRFEDNEFEIMKQHVMRGVEVLSETTGLSDPFLKPALEHHERVDGSGYPHHRRKADISEFGRIAAIVDIYDAITSDRCYHKAKPPHEALQFMYQLAQRGHVDGVLLQRFIQVVGVYPVGSCVALNTGETAIVRQVNREKPLQPCVLVVKSAGNTLLSTPEVTDLSQQLHKPRRTIHAALDPHIVGVNPAVYLDQEAA